MIDFNKQFFKKHQKALLFCANKWWLKWLLGLNRLPKELKDKKIAKIDVASISWEVGRTRKRTKYKGVFFTRPRFAESLAYNLSPFYYLKSYQTNKFQWRFSPAGLAFGLLFGYFGGVGFMGTTTNYYAGAGDGKVAYDNSGNAPSQAVWDTVHDATTGTTVDYVTAISDFARVRLRGTATYHIEIIRGFFPCDTSGLPDDATISAAILKLDIDIISDHLNDAYSYVAVVQTDQPSTAQLTTADYNNCGATNNPTKGSSDIDITGISTSGYTDFTLNVTGRGWINKTGTTMLGLREGHDIEDVFSDPGAADKYSRVYGNYSEQTGTDQDPYLEVTYTTVTVPTVTTQAATAVEQTTCTGNGNITATGGANATRRGFCYMTGTSGDPTTANSVAYDDGSFGTGAFTKGITGLTAGTGYRVKAYAVNSAGTSYGDTVQVNTNYILACSAGSFALTGQTVGLKADRKLVCSAGSFILTGIDVALHKGYTMVCECGNYALTGVSVGLRVARKLVCSAGSFTLTGVTVGLKAGRKIACDCGEFTLTGIDVILRKGYKIVCSVGSFTLTGIDVGLTKGYKLVCGTGKFILTGIDVLLKRGWRKRLIKNVTTFSKQEKQTTTFSKQEKRGSSWTKQPKP